MKQNDVTEKWLTVGCCFSAEGSQKTAWESAIPLALKMGMSFPFPRVPYWIFKSINITWKVPEINYA